MNMREISIRSTYESVLTDNGTERFIVKDISFQKKTIYTIIKRIFDFLASLIGIIVLAIPMLIIALLIKLDSKGPVIYKQERTGKNGKTFNLYKFRSMRTDAEAAGAVWAAKDDPRVTKLGKKLRATRLDELPQLFNILTGKMSIVGPRPERPIFYAKFSEYIDGFDKRLMVTPGLTGWAQINGGYDLPPEDKIVYDMEYIEKRSILMDIKIILHTAGIVVSHDGAR